MHASEMMYPYSTMWTRGTCEIHPPVFVELMERILIDCQLEGIETASKRQTTMLKLMKF